VKHRAVSLRQLSFLFYIFYSKSTIYVDYRLIVLILIEVS